MQLYSTYIDVIIVLLLQNSMQELEDQHHSLKRAVISSYIWDANSCSHGLGQKM